LIFLAEEVGVGPQVRVPSTARTPCGGEMGDGQDAATPGF
jgi:hypothetical protein